MANTKKNHETEEQAAEQQTDPVAEMVAKMVAEAMAQREAELAQREESLKQREEALEAEEKVEETGAVTTDNSDVWNEKREVFLSYATKGEEQFIFVAVNGRRYQVPRGRSVLVPLPLYERIQIMQEAELRTMEYANSLPNESYPNEAVRIG